MRRTVIHSANLAAPRPVACKDVASRASAKRGPAWGPCGAV